MFRLGLVSILFIGSSLHLNFFCRKVLSLVSIVFGGFVLLSLIEITLVSFAPHFVIALGK